MTNIKSITQKRNGDRIGLNVATTREILAATVPNVQWPNTLIYVALEEAFCERGTKYTNMAFNLANRDREPAPLVGSIYRA